MNELYPLKEAETPPSAHREGHALVEIAMMGGEIVLACWDCSTYYRTGLCDTDSAHLVSFKALLKAAEGIYGGAGDVTLKAAKALCRDCLLFHPADSVKDGKCEGCRGDRLQGRMYSVGYARERRKRAA